MSQLEERIERLEQRQQQSAEGEVSSRHSGRAAIRRQSQRTVRGWPLYQIALGPDPATGATRGHARAILAIGDRATGLIAIGGLAQGIFAIGGLSCGVVTLGGCSFALGAGLGGVIAGGWVTGGVAIGLKAAGGVAISLLPQILTLFGLHSPG